ncbi:MAG: SIS domain-containing protein [Nitrospinaceae bacterium]
MERVRNFLNASADLKYQVAETLSEPILEAARLIGKSLAGGGKLLLMGNGGSASDAQHIAAELIGRFKKERKPLPAIALTVDTSTLTALANDFGFETVFERQIEGLARKGDVVLGFSTSGNSENIIRGFQRANALGLVTIGLLGNEGGRAAEHATLAIIVPSGDTARIQEVHITIGHIICEIIEDGL